MSGINGNQLRALVIDDQRSMRLIVKNMLRTAGIENVAEAANGKAALAHLRSAGDEFPDVIISDLHMDEMDGMQFCNIVRSDKNLRNHHVPIIILTGDSDQMLHEVSKQVGAVSVLTKPVSAGEFGAHVARALGYSCA